MLAFDLGGDEGPEGRAVELALGFLEEGERDLERLETARGVTALVLRDLGQHEELVLGVGGYERSGGVC
ncbi:MAG TPA: hypothetical protein ENK02_05180 [Planctomycetes bacterium]|nr:hypothetical protein [Planctomycetota bacterium]